MNCNKKHLKSCTEQIIINANIYSHMKGGDNMAKNKEMQKLRVDLGITQEEAATMMNVAPATYRQVECGIRRGSNDFWDKFQESFNIPNEKMRDFQKGGE